MMTSLPIPRARIYHFSLWARYKGAIFSHMHADRDSSGLDTTFVHVVETSSNRLGFSGVDRSYHQYPYEVLFPGGVYERVPPRKLVLRLIADLFRHPSELVVLPGYHRPEHWAMLIVCMLLGRKRAVWVDSTAYDKQKSRLKEGAKRYFFQRCDGFFCYGVRSKEYVQSYGIDERKIFFRCQAAALPHNYSVAEVRRFYAENSEKPAGSPRFVYVGRLSAEKGLMDLLGALIETRKSLPGARLDFVGSGWIERELKEYCQEAGLSEVVGFLGPKSAEEIGQILMHSDALVLPSHSEPWGLVVNEALSYGCPVVVSDVCGCVPELVVNGSTGYSYPCGDVPALTGALTAVAELSSKRAEVAARCLDLIDQYSAEKAASEILGGCAQIIETMK